MFNIISFSVQSARINLSLLCAFLRKIVQTDNFLFISIKLMFTNPWIKNAFLHINLQRLFERKKKRPWAERRQWTSTSRNLFILSPPIYFGGLVRLFSLLNFKDSILYLYICLYLKNTQNDFKKGVLKLKLLFQLRSAF